MADKDERTSLPRYQNSDGFKLEIDIVSKMISDFEISSNSDDKDKIEILRKIEPLLKALPASSSKAPKFISNFLYDQNIQIRKLAYKCAFYLLSSNQNNNRLIIDAYRLSLLNSNYQVAQFALSNLQEFVLACPEESQNLLKFSSIAMKRLPSSFTSNESHISKSLASISQ